MSDGNGRKATSVLELISPSKAEKWLERNADVQRRISIFHVEFLASEMRAGRWIANNDAICFDDDGALINGQHRLNAVIKSGVSVECFVTRNIKSKEGFRTIDCGGKIRNARDILGMAGYTYTSSLSAASGIIIGYMTGIRDFQSKKIVRTETGSIMVKIAPDEILDFVKKTPALFPFAEKLSCRFKELPIGGPGFWTAMAYLFSLSSKSHVDEFMDRLCDGVGLEKDSPILVLRKKFILMRGGSGSPIAKEMAFFAIKAWNTFVRGEKMGVLKMLPGEQVQSLVSLPDYGRGVSKLVKAKK